MSGTSLLVLSLALAASLLLVAAGAGHLRRPVASAAALAAHGLPAGRRATAALGVVEVVLGTAATLLALAGPASALRVALAAQSALYVLVTVHLVRVLRGGRGGVPCGCGLPEVPVGAGVAVRAAVLAGASLAGLAWSESGGGAAVLRDPGLALVAAAAPTLALLLAVVPPARRLPVPPVPPVSAGGVR